ncbi:MAG: S1 RNA-binding domain-containing protein, partial [Lachnospiraceae bacterium]|nr:S1 RNA-binding domain-containing protein [Lachnospiraceae bacterium]
METMQTDTSEKKDMAAEKADHSEYENADNNELAAENDSSAKKEENMDTVLDTEVKETEVKEPEAAAEADAAAQPETADAAKEAAEPGAEETSTQESEAAAQAEEAEAAGADAAAQPEAAEAAKEAEEASTQESEAAPAESMKDMEKELEASYKMMGDGVHDTDTLLAWSKIMELYEAKENLTVEISGIVNKGVIAQVEGIRGFIPASRLSLRHVDDLNEWLGREIQVRIITADQSSDKLVLSAREILKEEHDTAKQQKLSAVEVGSVFDCKVDSILNYG